MTDRRRKTGLVALAVVVVAATVAWFYPDRPPAPLPKPVAEAPATEALAPDGLPPPKPTTPRNRATLPPRDAPLASIAPQLESLAARGDTRAACRLAVELVRCAAIELHMQEMEKPENQRTEEESTESEIDFQYFEKFANEDIWRIRQREQCRLLPQSLHDQAWSRLRAAALAGEPDAMLWYAISPDNGAMGHGNAILQHPGFDDWRREAPLMLERLFRSGDRDAAIALMVYNMSDMGPASGLIANDSQAALAYRILVWRWRSDAPPPPPMPRMSALEIERATLQAEAWHRDYFDNRLYPPRTGLGKLTPLWMLDADQPPPCE